MKHEQQFCTFEQAKILKAAGIKQESEWYWYAESGDPMLIDWMHAMGGSKIYSAYSCAELGMLLPAIVAAPDTGREYRFTAWREDDLYCIGYIYETQMAFVAKGTPEAEARAGALITLLQLKYPVELINQSF